MADHRDSRQFNPWHTTTAGGAGDARSSGWVILLLAAGGLVLVSVLLYWGGVRGGFLGSDRALLQRSPLIEPFVPGSSPGGLPRWAPRATTAVSLAMDRAIWGPLPAWFRATNLLLHVLATLAALAFFLEWTGRKLRIALPAATLFAVHPIHVEAVARAGARGEILATLFSLFALTLLGKARRGAGWALVPALALLLVATFASPIALVVPVLLVLVDLASAAGAREAARRFAAQWALVAAAALPSAVVSLLAAPPVAPQNRWLVGRAILEALRLLLVPVPLATYRILGPAQGIDLLSILALVLAGALLGAGWLVCRRLFATARAAGKTSGTGQALALGILMALVPVALLAILPPSPPGLDVPFALLDPSLYLPSAGICLALGAVLAMLVDRVIARRPAGGASDASGRSRADLVPRAITVLAIAVPFGAITMLRVPVLRDDISSLAAAATQEPRSSDLRVKLALAASGRGRADQAVQILTPLLAQRPNNMHLRLVLGNLYRDIREFDKAEQEIREALRIDPSSAAAHNTLGLIERDRGNVRAAESEYREAARLDPALADAHNNLGALLVAHGAPDEAMAELRRAVELDPTHGDAAANLASFLLRQNLQDDALAVLRRGLLYSEGNARLHYHVGVVLQRRGEREGAGDAYRHAIILDPTYARPMNNLAVILTEQKQYAEAIMLLGRVAELEPENAQAHYNLGISYRLSGDKDRAAAEFVAALRIRPDYPEASRALSEMASGAEPGPPPSLAPR